MIQPWKFTGSLPLYSVGRSPLNTVAGELDYFYMGQGQGHMVKEYVEP